MTPKARLASLKKVQPWKKFKKCTEARVEKFLL